MPQTYEIIEFRLAKGSAAGKYRVTPRVIGQSPVDGAEIEIDHQELIQLQIDPRQYGRRLGEQFFVEWIDEVYRSALQSAESKDAHLRVRLVLDSDAPELRDLLWERLQFGKGSKALGNQQWSPVTTDAKHPFSRFVMGANPRLGMETITRRPLRVLLIIASPSDINQYNLTPIPINERQAAYEVFEDPTTFEVLNLESDTDRPPTRKNIQETIADFEPHIVHFLCHGALNKKNGAEKQETLLFLEGEDAAVEVLIGSHLVEMFANFQSTPALCTFMACETSKESPDPFDAFLPLGPDLVKNGNVEAVVAMLSKIRMDTASLFAQAFYRRLSRHGIVDVAMNEARAAVFTRRDSQWSVPVLFMRTANGQIWQSAELEPAARQAVRPPHYYIDRPEIEETIKDLLKMNREGSNIVCLYGLPGVGKTTIARKIAEDLVDEFPDGTLWADLRDIEIIDVLSRFIKPYDPAFEASGFREEALLDRLQRLLSSKRALIVLDNVHSVDQVRRLIPQTNQRLAVLVIAVSNLPGLISRQQSVYVPEMTTVEAERLMRKFSGHRLPNTASETFRELGQRSYYIPKHILTMIHDCLRRRLRPVDYLKHWDHRFNRTFWVQQEQAALQHLHDQLAHEATRVFPYIGVMDEGLWNEDVLVAVSKLNIETIKTGLQQLTDIGFIVQEEDRYRVSPLARDFARTKLVEIGGEALLQACQSLLANYYLQLAQQFILRQRHNTLHKFLQDSSRQQRFFAKLMPNLVQKTASGFQDGASGEPQIPTKLDPVVINLDPLQLTFEEEVLKDLEFANRWSEAVGPGTLIEEKEHLLNALLHAYEQQDWALLQQLSTLGVGGFLIATDITSGTGSIDLQFAVVRDCNFTGSTLDTKLRAARMISCNWTACHLSAQWLGVHIHACDFTDTDMIGAGLLGLIATDCEFVDTDFRRCDLRGAAFNNCTFTGCNFDDADLTSARFDGQTQINGCSFDNVKGLDRLVSLFLIVNRIESRIAALPDQLPPQTAQALSQQWHSIRMLMADIDSVDAEAIAAQTDDFVSELPDLRPLAEQFLELLADVSGR